VRQEYYYFPPSVHLVTFGKIGAWIYPEHAICANNQTMISQATSVLDIPELSTKAKTAYKFNEMKQPLLSIRLLAGDGCKINITKDNIVVVKDNKIIMEGKRDKVSTLWMIPIKHHRKKQLLAQNLPAVPSVHAANSAYHQPTIAKLMAYLNATIGSQLKHFVML
jgi:hypothetical protein